MLMDVFVVPVGPDKYELYCETSVEGEGTPEPQPEGVLGKLRQRFSVMLKAAEERQHRYDPERAEPLSWAGRLQERTLAWVAERIAEQRLLWHLRKQTTAEAVHPQDMTFEQVMVLIRRILQRDYERHRLWLVVDTIGLIVSGLLMIVPGPNLLAYYFAFRVVGHWLSMRGAAQGLEHVTWTGRPCPPLTELREVPHLEPPMREARIHDVAARLRLQHLSTFFERVALRHA
jgi:Mitochondrial K+-H+ exchange-related